MSSRRCVRGAGDLPLERHAHKHLLKSLLDQLALHTTEAFQQAREEVIRRQQEDMIENGRLYLNIRSVSRMISS